MKDIINFNPLRQHKFQITIRQLIIIIRRIQPPTNTGLIRDYY